MRLELDDATNGVDSDYKTSAVIRDRETGEIVSRFGEGCYYFSFYQENDTAYVLGTKSDNGMLCGSSIMLYESKDLINWSSRPLISCDGWQFFNSSLTKGENGGSSRSLQKRIQLYGYFAGADFISEEWGMCNTFYDWKDFELTPYGKIKLDFLNIIKKYPKEKIGTPYTPVAVVLPKDLFGIAGLDDGENQTVFGYPLFGSAAETTRNVRKALNFLLSNPSDMVGCETANIINSDIPDCIDVIHEDYINLYEDYKFFVDLTGNPEFRRNHRCIPVEEAPDILENLLPCEVSGGVHWFVNNAADGWLLVMFNNSGIERSVEKGEYILPEGTREATVRLKNGQKLNILECANDIHFENDTYHIELQPGAWFLAEFK